MNSGGTKEESQTIYLICPPSLFLHLGEQRNVSFLLEGEGGAIERGRVRRWKNTRYGETRGEGESETKRKREDRKHRRREEAQHRGSVIRG